MGGKYCLVVMLEELVCRIVVIFGVVVNVCYWDFG